MTADSGGGITAASSFDCFPQKKLNPTITKTRTPTAAIHFQEPSPDTGLGGGNFNSLIASFASSRWAQSSQLAKYCTYPFTVPASRAALIRCSSRSLQPAVFSASRAASSVARNCAARASFSCSACFHLTASARSFSSSAARRDEAASSVLFFSSSLPATASSSRRIASFASSLWAQSSQLARYCAYPSFVPISRAASIRCSSRCLRPAAFSSSKALFSRGDSSCSTSAEQPSTTSWVKVSLQLSPNGRSKRPAPN